MTQHPPLLLIVNAAKDTFEMLEFAFQHEGYRTETIQARDVRQGTIDMVEVVEAHGVNVIVYDIAIPYEENWQFLQMLRARAGERLPPIVITTTNKNALDRLTGEQTQALEILGKPYDLGKLIAAVRRVTPAGLAESAANRQFDSR